MAGMPPVQLASLDYVPHPQLMCSNGSGITANREDGLAAYVHALLWFIEQDPRHAEKAIEILDSWTKIQQPPFDLANSLQVAWSASEWPRAAMGRQIVNTPGQLSCWVSAKKIIPAATPNILWGLSYTRGPFGSQAEFDKHAALSGVKQNWKSRRVGGQSWHP